LVDESKKEAQYCDQFRSKLLSIDPEEAIYALFWATFFDCFGSGLRLAEALPWNVAKDADSDDLGSRLSGIFETERLSERSKFGDHRRYIALHKGLGPIWQYALMCAERWKEAVVDAGDQKQLIGLGQNETWSQLWDRLGRIKPPFHRRLPRWDFLERASRLWSDLPEPDGMYIEGAGPEKGLIWLFFGDSVPKTEGCRVFRQHQAMILADWNDGVSPKMQLAAGIAYERFRGALEKWTIEFVRRNGEPSIVNGRYFLFNLESCICNIQKRRFK